jgi:hypothetical protein
MENMRLEDFEKIINLLEKVQTRSLDLKNKYMIDLFEYENDYLEIIDLLIKTTFQKEHLIDLINWYCYEKDFGREGLIITDENKNIIPIKSHKDFYDFLTNQSSHF